MQSWRAPVLAARQELLLACALRRETSALQKRLGNGIRFLTTGLGVRKTRNSLRQEFQQKCPSLLLFTGTAGQLDPTVTAGQVVLPEEWCLQEGACFPASREIIDFLREVGDWEITGRGLTVSAPVVRAKTRRSLFGRSGARVCDMESAAALEIALRFGVKCLAPKVVSDTADGGLSSFWRGFEDSMDSLAEYLGRLVGSLTDQPDSSESRPPPGL